MTLSSPDISEGSGITDPHVFDGFGCSGGNMAPALSWSGAPEGTESYIVTVFDPDAPTGSGWWHWTVFNIPADVTSLPQGAGDTAPLPEGAGEGRTDYGPTGYGGPCPPEGHGPHRYIFTVYAMPEATLPLDETSSGALVGFYANNQALDSASLTATYER
nr:YbhB/YbcL family Raf kinase inhibitor-like protein [Roseospira navarrensis]